MSARHASEILNEMKSRSIHNDVVSFGIILRNLNLGEDSHGFVEMVHLMNKRNVPRDSYIHTQILSHTGRVHGAEAAEGVLLALVKAGAEVKEMEWAVVIDKYGKNGNYDKVYELYNMFKTTGLTTPNGMYSSLILIELRCRKNFCRALAYLEESKKAGSVDSRFYYALIKYLCVIGGGEVDSVDRAYGLLVEAMRQNLKLDRRMFDILITAHNKLGLGSDATAIGEMKNAYKLLRTSRDDDDDGDLALTL
ncbi:hypothetical protein HK097_004875 [Rhizophlyctis rosea]|uniref:Pentatricopeptide repeat-containing protein n=1 Tax=Rhizophlyctis rosea TaxID=64517 RepID=A0AAD5SJX7_9FUNG|nr:hypothetical protein HK097_004875 [Rhizophlyctis rosea]